MAAWQLRKKAVGYKFDGLDNRRAASKVSNIGDNEKVSAAILAKVLEERGKERSARYKFCIDVGTQTHGWHFNDKDIPGSKQSQTPSPTSSAASAAAASSLEEEHRVAKSSSARYAAQRSYHHLASKSHPLALINHIQLFQCT